jgi:hypothetical protein
LRTATGSAPSASPARLPGSSNEIEGRLQLDTGMVDRTTAAAAWAEGRAMSVDEAIAYALERGSAAIEVRPPVARPDLQVAQ